MEGLKEVLGLWIAETEGAKFWLQVVTEIKNRGVDDILIASVDGLKGFPEAIESVFGNTITLDARTVDKFHDEGLTINGGQHDTVKIAAADDVWYVSAVDDSHISFAAASGSLVSINNEVSVLFI